MRLYFRRMTARCIAPANFFLRNLSHNRVMSFISLYRLLSKVLALLFSLKFNIKVLLSVLHTNSIIHHERFSLDWVLENLEWSRGLSFSWSASFMHDLPSLPHSLRIPISGVHLREQGLLSSYCAGFLSELVAQSLLLRNAWRAQTAIIFDRCFNLIIYTLKPVHLFYYKSHWHYSHKRVKNLNVKVKQNRRINLTL